MTPPAPDAKPQATRPTSNAIFARASACPMAPARRSPATFAAAIATIATSATDFGSSCGQVDCAYAPRPIESAAVRPGSITSRHFHPYRKPASGPYASRR